MEFIIPEPTDDARWFGGADPAGGFGIRRATDPCDGCEPGHIVVIVTPQSVTAAVEEWTSLDGASLTGTEPADLGGATGLLFEGAVPSELNVAIVHGGYNPHGLVAVYALDVGGQAVIVVINQYSTAEPFFDDAREVVDSFRFDI